MNQAGSVLSGWRRSSAWSRTWLQKRSTTSSRLWVGTWHKAAILSTLLLHASIWHVGLAQTLNKVCMCLSTFLSSVLWRCWLGGRKGIRPVKTEWWGAGMVICLERGADMHMAQLMPLPLIVSCFSKILIGFAFLVPAHLGSPGQRAVKRVCWLSGVAGSELVELTALVKLFFN